MRPSEIFLLAPEVRGIGSGRRKEKSQVRGLQQFINIIVLIVVCRLVFFEVQYSLMKA